jgi:hypothetical protein
MRNDEKFIAEAYTRIYLEADTDFRDQMPSSAEVYEPEADKKAAQAEVNGDSNWEEKFIPYGPFQIGKYYIGKDANGREYATWETRDDDGDRYYYEYYVVYKGDQKAQEISEEQHNELCRLGSRPRR